MKRLALLGLGLLLGWGLPAETVLIAHAQSLPEALADSFQSQASKVLVDMVFDALFDKGDIAFDTAVASPADATTSWLASLSKTYGADKVVYLGVYWKAGQDQAAVLDRVTYQVVGKGVVVRQGSVTGTLVAASRDEAKDTRTVGTKLVSGLAL